jgi:hypothetical protein
VSSSSKTHMENAFSWDDKLPCPCHLRASSQSCCSTHKPPQEGTGDKPALIPGPCEWESKALWLDPFPSILKKQIQDWRDGSSKHEALSSNPNITKKQKQIILKKKPTNPRAVCLYIHVHVCLGVEAFHSTKREKPPKSTSPISFKYFSYFIWPLSWSGFQSFFQATNNKRRSYSLKDHGYIFHLVESGILELKS